MVNDFFHEKRRIELKWLWHPRRPSKKKETNGRRFFSLRKGESNWNKTFYRHCRHEPPQMSQKWQHLEKIKLFWVCSTAGDWGRGTGGYNLCRKKLDAFLFWKCCIHLGIFLTYFKHLLTAFWLVEGSSFEMSCHSNLREGAEKSGSLCRLFFSQVDLQEFIGDQSIEINVWKHFF